MFLSPTEFAREKGLEPELERQLLKYLGIEPVVVSPQKARFFDTAVLEVVFTRLEELKAFLLRDCKGKRSE
ncbi:hypothetical protein [uncultured Mesotoga sp.]|uniref:hypothetical protein n=1 Tax=uncultured Mesotoga sp. TaxID=1184400 RepID=UPI002596CF90|nr:hypothetical protein [uncultured Mesotoga sp.]